MSLLPSGMYGKDVQLISRKVNPEPEVTVGEDFAPRKMLLMAIHVQQSKQILHNLI